VKLTKQILNKLILEEIDEAESVESIYNTEAEGYENIVDLFNQAMKLEREQAVDLIRLAMDLGASLELFADADEVYKVTSVRAGGTQVLVRMPSVEEGRKFHAFLQSMPGWIESSRAINRDIGGGKGFTQIATTGFVLFTPPPKRKDLKEILKNLFRETLEDTGDSEESDDAERKKVGDLLNHEDEDRALQGLDFAEMLFPEEVEKAKVMAKRIMKWSLNRTVEIDNELVAEQVTSQQYEKADRESVYKETYTNWQKKLKPIYDLIENFDGSQEAFDNIIDTQHQMYLEWSDKRTLLPAWYFGQVQSIKGERKLDVWPQMVFGFVDWSKGVFPDQIDLFHGGKRGKGEYKGDAVEQVVINLLKNSFS